jgi:hypothetical protein
MLHSLFSANLPRKSKSACIPNLPIVTNNWFRKSKVSDLELILERKETCLCHCGFRILFATVNHILKKYTEAVSSENCMIYLYLDPGVSREKTIPLSWSKRNENNT